MILTTNLELSEMILIETYWNVNYNDTPKIISNASILIETYWNVNGDSVVCEMITKININRDILECKSRFSLDSRLMSLILIETYWNVNLFPVSCELMQNNILIETYWNVN